MSTSFLPVVTALKISIGQCHTSEGESHAGEGKGFTGEGKGFTGEGKGFTGEGKGFTSSGEEQRVEMEGELSYTGEMSSLG